jgi:hypothetical protein
MFTPASAILPVTGSKLTHHLLLQPQEHNRAACAHRYARRLKGVAGAHPICEEEVGRSLPTHHPCAAALNADAGIAKRSAHFGEGAGAVVQQDFQIEHVVSFQEPCAALLSSGDWSRSSWL